jgi:mannose-6-phosphate isomerase-like protein (cupin superfamily)
MSQPAFALVETYVQLADDGGAQTIAVGDDFWERIDERTELHGGRLLCMFPLAAGEGDHSEMHPAGDELLIATAGTIEVVLEEPGGERVVELGAGRACVVPRATWHRLRSARGGTLIAITPGAGTEHRPWPAPPSASR